MLFLSFLTQSRKTLLSLYMIATIVVLGTISSPAFGYSHAYINQFRSSTRSPIFVSQSLEGEYGQYSLRGKLIPDGSGTDGKVLGNVKSNWRGIGLRTAVGLELMKFIQFIAGHTFINMRNQEDGLEQLEGSRLHAEAKVVFISPIVNLEVGGGASVTRADYQRALDNASFVGSGVYYSIGGNYFLSSRLSVFGKGKSFNDRLMRNSGSATISEITTRTTAVSMGFRIWM